MTIGDQIRAVFYLACVLLLISVLIVMNYTLSIFVIFIALIPFSIIIYLISKVRCPHCYNSLFTKENDFVLFKIFTPAFISFKEKCPHCGKPIEKLNMGDFK